MPSRFRALFRRWFGHAEAPVPPAVDAPTDSTTTPSPQEEYGRLNGEAHRLRLEAIERIRRGEPSGWAQVLHTQLDAEEMDAKARRSDSYVRGAAGAVAFAASVVRGEVVRAEKSTDTEVPTLIALRDALGPARTRFYSLEDDPDGAGGGCFSAVESHLHALLEAHGIPRPPEQRVWSAES